MDVRASSRDTEAEDTASSRKRGTASSSTSSNLPGLLSDKWTYARKKDLPRESQRGIGIPNHSESHQYEKIEVELPLKKRKTSSLTHDSDEKQEVNQSLDDHDELSASMTPLTTVEGQLAANPRFTKAEAKAEAKREYHRQHAALCRSRNKNLVNELRKKVDELTHLNNQFQQRIASLESENAIIRDQLQEERSSKSAALDISARRLNLAKGAREIFAQTPNLPILPNYQLDPAFHSMFQPRQSLVPASVLSGLYPSYSSLVSTISDRVDSQNRLMTQSRSQAYLENMVARHSDERRRQLDVRQGNNDDATRQLLLQAQALQSLLRSDNRSGSGPRI